MLIQTVETLISAGNFSNSTEWRTILDHIIHDISSMSWPTGSGQFLIYPESGKKRGEGNGVKPIKDILMHKLAQWGWKLEDPLDIATVKKPGKLDAVLHTDFGDIALEWETGNISSSHRALNKMALGLQHSKLVAGILIVPTRNLYQYLTDRVGNYEELSPYFGLWRSFPCSEGILIIIAIEHNGTSTDVPRIPKGTDGRALA